MGAFGASSKLKAESSKGSTDYASGSAWLTGRWVEAYGSESRFHRLKEEWGASLKIRENMKPFLIRGGDEGVFY